MFASSPMRPLKNAPFRSLRLSAEFQRQAQILILEIFNIFLWLKSSPSLILTKIEHFSKVSTCFGRYWGQKINIETPFILRVEHDTVGYTESQ